MQGFIVGNWNIGKSFLSLVKLEAQLAGLSVYPLLISMCMLLIILMSTWLSTMLLLGYAFLYMLGSVLLALSGVLLLNLILLVIFLKCITYNLKKMSFEKTREFLTNKRKSNESTQSIDHQDSTNRESVGISKE